MSEKSGSVYTKDNNGCSHDNPDFWQQQSSTIYSSSNYRKSLVNSNQRHKLLSETCWLCGGPIMKPQPGQEGKNMGEDQDFHLI